MTPPDPIERSLAAWKDATEGVSAPPQWTGEVISAIRQREGSGVARAIWRSARTLAVIGLPLAVALVGASVREAHRLEQVLETHAGVVP